MSKYTDDIIPPFLECNNRGAEPTEMATFMKDRHLHPDGQAWKKPCTVGEPGMYWGDCLFTHLNRTGDTCVSNIWQTPFICTHRQDEGYLRVCAGWHALNKKRCDK